MENTALAVKPAPELNLDIIRKYVCPKATDQEAFTFLQLCKAQNLNPFLREAYLVKYGDEAATIITGKDTFTKRADRIPQYDGFKAGIIVLSNGKVQYREGSFMVKGESLLGGWAEVYRKDRSTPFRNEVALEEYERRKKDGTVMSNWKTMPATMIRKVALVQSLREAFPDELGGLYSPEEMPIDSSVLPTYKFGEKPEIPAPQGEKPSLTQPGRKSEAVKTEPTPAGNQITLMVEDVKKQTGTNSKTGKSWTKYIVKAGDKDYGTFSETFAQIAKDSMQGAVPVEITFTTNKFGNDISAIQIVEPPKEEEQGSKQPGDSDD